VSATSCDVGFFFSVSYVVSLPNCRHVVVVTTHHVPCTPCVSDLDQETGNNLHTQERNERFSTLQLLTSSVWRHLSRSCFCHVLVGAAQKMHIFPPQVKSTYASTTQNTTTQHTTINMSRSRPTLQWLALSLSMGRAVAPPNHGASAPQHHTQAASRRACAYCRWSDRLGGRNERHRKIERGGSALALGGHRFKCYNNNQMGDDDEVRGCVGEEAMLGRNVWG
jgi:hypothetical protein